jgi:hypothetical protein
MQALKYHEDDSWLTPVQGVSRILNIIKIVENTIKGSDIYLTKSQLLTRLPIKMTPPALQIILDLFKDKDEIIYDKDGTIVWVGSDGLQTKIFRKEFTTLR